MPRLMMERPSASSALARAKTSKAVSVPRSDIRFARASMGDLALTRGEEGAVMTDTRRRAKRLGATGTETSRALPRGGLRPSLEHDLDPAVARLARAVRRGHGRSEE